MFDGQPSGYYIVIRNDAHVSWRFVCYYTALDGTVVFAGDATRYPSSVIKEVLGAVDMPS